MKLLALHRLSIAWLTTVLLLCACVIVSQQRDIQRLRLENRAYKIMSDNTLRLLIDRGLIPDA